MSLAAKVDVGGVTTMVTGFSCRERRTPSGRSPTHRTGFRQPATMSQKKEWINLLELETLAQPKVDKMVGPDQSLQTLAGRGVLYMNGLLTLMLTCQLVRLEQP